MEFIKLTIASFLISLFITSISYAMSFQLDIFGSIDEGYVIRPYGEGEFFNGNYSYDLLDNLSFSGTIFLDEVEVGPPWGHEFRSELFIGNEPFFQSTGNSYSLPVDISFNEGDKDFGMAVEFQHDFWLPSDVSMAINYYQDGYYQNYLSLDVGDLYGVGNYSVVSTDFRYQVRRNQPVPEPATMILFGVGIAGIVGKRLRQER